MAIELTQEINRRITTVTEDTTFLFQRRNCCTLKVLFN